METQKNEFVLEKLVETLTQACLDLNPIIYREIMPYFAENEKVIADLTLAAKDARYHLQASCTNILKISRLHRASKQKE